MNGAGEMVVAFTGTRQGMTWAQIDAFTSLLWDVNAFGVMFRHGGAVGADRQAHALVRSIQPAWRVQVVLPAHDVWDVRGEERRWVSVMRTGKTPLARDDDIIADAELVIATPAGTVELPRGSGTWATMRHARKAGQRLVVVWPDGSDSEDWVSRR